MVAATLSCDPREEDDCSDLGADVTEILQIFPQSASLIN
jgi:hypothetical protein